MGFLKKALRIVGKVAKPILATTPAGQLALRAQSTFKSLGGNLKAAKLGKVQPLSLTAPIAKILPPGPAKRLKRLSPASSGRKKGSRMPSAAKTANGKGKRVPPPGGLDLKAMAAQWRAAGKPGTWLGWIKANPIKR